MWYSFYIYLIFLVFYLAIFTFNFVGWLCLLNLWWRLTIDVGKSVNEGTFHGTFF